MDDARLEIWARAHNKYCILTFDSKDGMWFARNPERQEIFGMAHSLPHAIKQAYDKGFDCKYWKSPRSEALLCTSAIRR